ncbi:hypothetical protein [Secundilactobacillus paracollinoides]|uniref:hypothetical protein n=1 Tax=Secundilactobacillus paracollinoides TaxID=240427 RepID=UPI0007048C9B|nr:hypothetical protein [Secundilactobacillus paracollinoides]
MEWGTISEWVAAISEFLAVCVALFLPYMNERREQKRKLRNLRISIKNMGEEAIAGDKVALRTLDMVLIISFLNSTGAANEKVAVTGRKIIELIKALPAQDSADYPEKIAEVRALIDAVQNK